jgi:hypothetical protein
VSQVRDIVLMSVYLDLGNPGGGWDLDEGVYEQGEGMESLVYNNLGTRWTDPITARRVPSK